MRHYVVTYVMYHNDRDQKKERKAFGSLEAIKRWLFDYKGERERDFFSYSPYFDEPGDIQSENEYEHYDIWVKMIERDGKIIFSSGRFTGGRKHWTKEVKQWCKDMQSEHNTPSWEFAEE